MLDQIRLRTVLSTAVTIIIVSAISLLAVMSWRYQTPAQDSLALSIVTVIIGLAVGMLLGFGGWLIHLTVKAATTLQICAQKITSGEFIESQLTRFPEVNALFTAFNTSAASTAQLKTQLALAHAALEDEVSERQRAEQQTREQERRLCAIQNVAALSATLSFDEHIGEILRVGCRLLDLESALITQVDSKRNEGNVIGLVASPHQPLHCGSKFPLKGSFCEHAFESGTLAIHHTSRSHWARSNTFNAVNEEAHIETVIYVNGAKYGTISFGSPVPRQEAYRDTDIELVKLIGRLAGIAIEREKMRRDSDQVQQEIKTDAPRLRPKIRSSLLEPFIQ